MARAPDVDGKSPGGLPSFITSNADFYTFQNGELPGPPNPGEDHLFLSDGRSSLSLTPDQIRGMARLTVTRTIQCVGQGKPGPTAFSWRWGGISTAVWGAVPLRDVLSLTNMLGEGSHLLAQGRDGWGRAIERSQIVDSEDVVIAVSMNGEPLPHDHGAPMRLLVPGHFGEMQVKWLNALEWADKPDDQADDLQVRPMAFATAPAWGAHTAGRLTLSGVAYAGLAPVVAVELAVEGQREAWATLLDVPQPGVWRRWQAELRLPPGDHLLRIAAIDALGRRSQPIDPDAKWGKAGQPITHDLVLSSG